MTREEIEKDLERMKKFGNYPENNCECNACTLTRLTTSLLSECERLEERIKLAEATRDDALAYAKMFKEKLVEEKR